MFFLFNEFLGYILLGWILIAVIIFVAKKEFDKSDYKDISGNSFLQTYLNSGNRGEYQLFRYLDELKIEKKILTNLYLPMKKGETTEVDLVMITEIGFFVLESKNYTGWIYGNEKYKNWTETFKSSKHKFYNPIWQNNGHINALKALSGFNDLPYYSYIVFSNQATLKKISYFSPNVKVLQRNGIKKAIMNEYHKTKKVFSSNDINSYSETLIKYGLADEEIKKNHINSVRNKHRK